jgi:hypothetical protein
LRPVGHQRSWTKQDLTAFIVCVRCQSQFHRHPFYSESELISGAPARYEGFALFFSSVTPLKRAYSRFQADGILLAILIIKEPQKMTTINYRSKVGGALLVLSLLFGIGIMSGMTAQAQGAHNGEWQRRDRNRNNNRDQDQVWQRNQNRNDDRYQNRIRRDVRYDRDNRYGNNGSYNNSSQIALNQGYQAGLNTGASDAQRGQSYSPQRSHYYKDASSLQFRNGFVQGYNAGYRQYGGYNNNGDYRRSDNGSGIGSILGSILGRP